jgi:hypothetical protein
MRGTIILSWAMASSVHRKGFVSYGIIVGKNVTPQEFDIVTQ